MRTAQKQVAEFMRRAGQHVATSPTIPSPAVRELRVRLLLEEVLEFADASGVEILVPAPQGFWAKLTWLVTGQTFPLCRMLRQLQWRVNRSVNEVEAFDAIVDIAYVNLGAAAAWGLPLNQGFREVHRSNLTKFIDGQRREDGKWIKGPSYSPPDLLSIIGSAKHRQFRPTTRKMNNQKRIK